MARIALLFFILANSTTIFSQAISLSGTVLNAKGKAIVGAHITLVNQKCTVGTDSAGLFRITSEASDKINVPQYKECYRNSWLFSQRALVLSVHSDWNNDSTERCPE
jgi:hypothetical protein